MILHHYGIHLYHDNRGQRQNSRTDTYAESPEAAIAKTRSKLFRMKDPRAKWEMESKELKS